MDGEDDGDGEDGEACGVEDGGGGGFTVSIEVVGEEGGIDGSWSTCAEDEDGGDFMAELEELG